MDQKPAQAVSTSASQTQEDQEKQEWGRVLLAGGVDWTRLGKKEKSGAPAEENKRPDLLQPHILRSLANVRIISIHTSPCACHCIALDTDGAAWMFGRNTSSALGVPNVDEVSENAPRRVTPQSLKAAKGTRFVHAACGRGHSLLVGSGGEVWSCGANTFGQCGHALSHSEVHHFKLIDGPKSAGKKECVIKAAAGVTFSVVLTNTGKVYAFGSGEKGQLGNGRTGEHITAGNKTGYDIHIEPVLVKGLANKNIIDIASGTQHSILLDSEGFVYVFGYNGYCRLGLGDQQDVLVPKVVPQFAGTNELTRAYKVFAGPTNSVVIDRNRMYWVAGKWKNSGDGSTGQPYTTFKYLPDIQACKMFHAASGGVTHFALCPDEEETGVMTIAWGQNAANGELGLGEEQPKSATKPIRVVPLTDIKVIDVAAAQNTTFFLAKPSQQLSDSPRHPVDLEGTPEACAGCHEDTGDEDETLLECEKCDTPYHLSCLKPPLASVPEGEWFCDKCAAKPGAPIGDVPEPTNTNMKKKKKKSSGSAGSGAGGGGGAPASGGGGGGGGTASKAKKSKKQQPVDDDDDDEGGGAGGGGDESDYKDDDGGSESGVVVKSGQKRKGGTGGQKGGAKRKK